MHNCPYQPSGHQSWCRHEIRGWTRERRPYLGRITAFLTCMRKRKTEIQKSFPAGTAPERQQTSQGKTLEWTKVPQTGIKMVLDEGMKGLGWRAGLSQQDNGFGDPADPCGHRTAIKQIACGFVTEVFCQTNEDLRLQIWNEHPSPTLTAFAMRHWCSPNGKGDMWWMKDTRPLISLLLLLPVSLGALQTPNPGESKVKSPLETLMCCTAANGWLLRTV